MLNKICSLKTIPSSFPTLHSNCVILPLLLLVLLSVTPSPTDETSKNLDCLFDKTMEIEIEPLKNE